MQQGYGRRLNTVYSHLVLKRNTNPIPPQLHAHNLRQAACVSAAGMKLRWTQAQVRLLDSAVHAKITRSSGASTGDGEGSKERLAWLRKLSSPMHRPAWSSQIITCTQREGNDVRP